MKNKLIITAFCVVAIALLIFLSRGININKSAGEHYGDTTSYREADLRVEIIPAPNQTYGYNILMNGRILIHQPNIPALSGNQGFESEGDAQRVAEFVIHKIRQNIFPPSVSVQDLDSLGVL
jgi:hypothetical protein